MTLILLLVGLLWVLILFRLWRVGHDSGRAGWPSVADVAAGGVLFLLTLGFFWRTLTGDVYQPADGGDLVSFLFPTWRFAASELAAGRLPLWNPHLYGGAPFVADIQAGFFYPPHLLMFLLRPDFPYAWLQVSAILHLYWAGLGSYVLMRTLRLPGSAAGGWQIHPVAALFGALAFAFSDPLLIHLGNLNLIAVLAWLPWTAAAFYRALARRSLLWAALAGVLYACGILAGHAQSMLYVALALALYTIFQTTVETPHAARTGGLNAALPLWSRALALLALTVGLAVLLSAPALFPALAHPQHTGRADFTYQDTVSYSLAPVQMVGMLTPGFFGRGPGLHWGLWQRVETPYVGVAALLLAVTAILLSGRAHRRLLLPWLGMALFGLLAGMGIYAILHGWLTEFAPFFGQLRAPARALVLWALGMALLAGVGADLVARVTPGQTTAGLRGLRSFLRAGTLILLGVVGPLLLLALLLTQESEVAFLRTSVAGLALTLAAGFWLATWLLVEARTVPDEQPDPDEQAGPDVQPDEVPDEETPAGSTAPNAGRLAPAAFLVLLTALLFVDLSATGAYTDISPDDPTRGFNHPEIVAWLRDEATRTAADGPFRIDSLTDIRSLWQPDAAALHGLEDVGGIDNPLALERWKQAWEATGGRDTARYQLLNVRFVVARDGTPLPANFALALDAPGELSLYRNAEAFPRAFLAHEVDGLHVPDPAQPSVSFGPFTPNRLEVRAEPASAALLVFSEVDYPGWTARVNGAPVPMEQANGFQRAVRLEPGSSTVVLTFAPAPLRWGWAGLATGIIVLAALVVWSVRARR